MDFRILGPLEVHAGGRALPLGGRQQRALLALLLLRANEVVPVEQIIDELWPEAPPLSATKSVHALVSRLRRLLEDHPTAGNEVEDRNGVLLTRAHGYLLRVAPGELDLQRFESLLTEGRDALAAGQADVAARTLREALALWRGPPLAEFAHDSFAVVEVARLNELRLSALEERIDADLASGRSAELVAELEALVAPQPLRERLRGQLMLALYRSGRQADALGQYQETRRKLLDELGLEPSQALQRLEHAILVQEPWLEAPSASRVPALKPAFKGLGRRGAVVLGSAMLVVLTAIVVAVALVANDGPSVVRVAPNSLAVIDPDRGEVVDTVPVGVRPGPLSFAAGSLWVGNLGDRTVSRIDLATDSVTATIPVGVGPVALAATSDSVWAGGADGVLRRIDPAFAIVAERLRLGSSPFGGSGLSILAVDQQSVWTVGSAGVVRVGLSARRVAMRVPRFGTRAVGAAASAGALWVATVGHGASLVSRVDQTGTVTATIPAGQSLRGVAVGAGGVWVADDLANAVLRIDPATKAMTTTIPVGRAPVAVAVGAGSVWSANSGDGTVSRIDPTTSRVVETIDVGGSPQGIVVAAERVLVTVQAAAPAVPVRRGGTLRVSLASRLDFPQFSLDPATDYNAVGWQIAYATCAKLLNYPDRAALEGSIPEPEVARGQPKVSADRRTYTFTIRPGYRFSPPSNEVVTAQTFRDSIERSLGPGKEFAPAFMGDLVGLGAYRSGKTNHIAGIAARGDRLTIRLTDPAPSLLARLTMPFFCAVPRSTPADSHGAPIASAGPYYVSSYTPGQQIVLSRNPNYQGSRPHRLERIVFTLGVNPVTAVDQIEAGRADYTSRLPVTDYPRLERLYGAGASNRTAKQPQFVVNPTANRWFYAMNTSRPLFADAVLRRAVNYAVDRRALARQGSPDGGASPHIVEPNDQYLPAGWPGFARVSVYPLSGDVARARRLGGRRGTVVLYTCAVSPCPEQAQILKANLRAIGLELEIRTFAIAALFEKVAAVDEPYDLILYGWLPDYPDPSNILNTLLDGASIRPGSIFNAARLDDPAVNRELRRVATLTGPQRYSAYRRLALDLARNVAPWIAYGTELSHELFSSRVGCQVYQAAYFGTDLAALCLRR